VERTPPAAQAARLDPLKKVHEDEDLLVVFKPPGLLTSTVPRERRATALAIVRQYLMASDARARVGLIHRLDRDAAGLLVFSKNRAAFESLKRQFFHHTVERVYEAEVVGRVKPRKGRIESRLVEWPDGSVHSTLAPGKGQVAITDYAVIQQQKATALLRVTLLTGRKHQIRAHLGERGWPIVGDPIYGKPGRGGRASPGGLRLVAVALAFDHPRGGQRIRFTIPGLAQGRADNPPGSG
jgi:RluA family pseudouridine synthase